MTIPDAMEFVFDHDVQLLGMLAETRLAVYRNVQAHRMPTNTIGQAIAAEDAQARAGVAAEEAQSRLYSLMTAEIDETIDREEAEVRETRSEASGTQR